jgi:hypothetical protein
MIRGPDPRKNKQLLLRRDAQSANAVQDTGGTLNNTSGRMMGSKIYFGKRRLFCTAKSLACGEMRSWNAN